MREEHTNRMGSILTTTLVGGVVGAGLGLLLAPKSGTEIRRDLRRAADRVTQAVDIGKGLYGESREFVGKAIEAGKKAYVEEKPLKRITNGKGPLMVSVLASGIIGAGIGLLLAPKAGRETRADLKKFAADARVTVASAVDKSKDLLVEGKSAITGAVEAGKKVYTEVKEKITHAA